MHILYFINAVRIKTVKGIILHKNKLLDTNKI